MLINATRAQQLRVAVVDGTILQDYQVQIEESGLTRGNIYRGVVANVQPSLNAAFVEIGEERHGFLPVGDVNEASYHKKPPKNKRRPNIDQVLKRGKQILVQVTKDGAGQKGAALTTNIALAGRYLVLTPFDSVRGISRKAEDDKRRKTIKQRLKKLDLPNGHGVIVRTNGIDQNQATLDRDLRALLRLWKKVQQEAERGKGARLLYSDQDLVVQALRDYLDPDIQEVVVDSDEVYDKAEGYMKAFMPRSKTKLVRYKDKLPLFSRYRLESQIDKIYDRTAALPSGGSIVIDQTEALTAIDVNSARATRTSNHEESIFKINCEAAKEVGRQLRLRDIGGLVVVDFIDMRLRKHRSKLERTMRDAMKPDKARWSVGRVSPNGLLEINRQRIKQSLRLRTHRPCPTCQGLATIPTPEFSALRILSRIEGRAASGRIKGVTIGLHPEMADVLQNHFRKELMGLEQDHEVEVEVIAAPNLRRTEERLEWIELDPEERKKREKEESKSEAAFSATDLTAESKGRRRRSERRDEDEERSRSKSRRRARSKKEEDEDEERQKSRRARRRSRKKDDDEEKSDSGRSGRSRSRSRKRAKSEDEKDDSRARSRSRSRKKSDDQDKDKDKGDDSQRRRRRRRSASKEDEGDKKESRSKKSSRSRSRKKADDDSSTRQRSRSRRAKKSDDDSDDDSGSRRRRRSRSRSGSGSDDSPSEKSRPSGGRRSSGRSGSRSRSRSRSGSRRSASSGRKSGGNSDDDESARAASGDAPIGVLAGQGRSDGEDAEGNKVHWQWWGGPAEPAPEPKGAED